MAVPPLRVAPAHLDFEDVLQQIGAELLAKDRNFDPSRGSCTTCAGAVVDRLSQRLGDRLCWGPGWKPLGADLGDDRAGTPPGIDRTVGGPPAGR
jgi:hypothetical protein